MPGKIKVKILAGRNLPVMDRSGDTTDAYVEIKFGNTTYKTDVCRKSLNPQWNSEWYRFEVDDAELQDEPLQVRLMDHDTYSANDAIGKVYVNLNPLLLPGLPPTVKNIWTLEATMNSSIGSQGGSVMTGWIPVFDTMHGIRGEVNIIVKVELFSDCNKFRQSSCGVQFFYSPNIPHGYHAQVIHGFVEELVVSDDPEYKWIDKIRTPRASNEARQTLFFKLSGEVQRKIGLKALDLGGNAVIGYVQNFDLEGESGIVARGIGTAVTLVKLQDITSIPPVENQNIEDLTSFGLQSKNSFDFSESDDSLPLLSHSPNLTPVPRSPINIRTTTVSHRFPKTERSNRNHQHIRVSHYRASSLRSRQLSLESSATSVGNQPRKIAVSTLSLADDLISETSLKNLLALEDMRGEPTGNPFSRGLKNFRYFQQNILPRRVAQVKTKITDSLDDESDQESNYSSTWSLAGSESTRSSIVDLRQSIRRKKFTHKKNPSDGIAAMLIRSVHSGFPLDSVREDRETPTPSPVNFLDGEICEEGNPNDVSTISRKDENYGRDKILIGKKKKRDSQFAGGIGIPMISSSETDTSTSDDDEPSESSTNYNILEDTYPLIDPRSSDERKFESGIRAIGKLEENRGIAEKFVGIGGGVDFNDGGDDVLGFVSGGENLESSTDYNILEDNYSGVDANSMDEEEFEQNFRRESGKIGFSKSLEKKDSKILVQDVIEDLTDSEARIEDEVTRKIEINLQRAMEVEKFSKSAMMDFSKSLVEKENLISEYNSVKSCEPFEIHGVIEETLSKSEIVDFSKSSKERKDMLSGSRRDVQSVEGIEKSIEDVEEVEGSRKSGEIDFSKSLENEVFRKIKLEDVIDHSLTVQESRGDQSSSEKSSESDTTEFSKYSKQDEDLPLLADRDDEFQKTVRIDLHEIEDIEKSEKIDNDHFSKSSKEDEIMPSPENREVQTGEKGDIDFHQDEKVEKLSEYDKNIFSKSSKKIEDLEIQFIDEIKLPLTSQKHCGIQSIDPNLSESEKVGFSKSSKLIDNETDSLSTLQVESPEKLGLNPPESVQSEKLCESHESDCSKSLESVEDSETMFPEKIDFLSILQIESSDKLEMDLQRAMADAKLAEIHAKIEELLTLREDFIVEPATDDGRSTASQLSGNFESTEVLQILDKSLSLLDCHAENPNFPEKIESTESSEFRPTVVAVTLKKPSKNLEKSEEIKSESENLRKELSTSESNINFAKSDCQILESVESKYEHNLDSSSESKELPLEKNQQIEDDESKEGNPTSIMLRDCHSTSSTNYNFLDESSSPIETNSLDDGKFEASSRKQPDSILVSDDETVEDLGIRKDVKIDAEIKENRTVDSDEKFESSTDYNILDESSSLVDSIDDGKFETSLREAIESLKMPKIQNSSTSNPSSIESEKYLEKPEDIANESQNLVNKSLPFIIESIKLPENPSTSMSSTSSTDKLEKYLEKSEDISTGSQIEGNESIQQASSCMEIPQNLSTPESSQSSIEKLDECPKKSSNLEKNPSTPSSTIPIKKTAKDLEESEESKILSKSKENLSPLRISSYLATPPVSPNFDESKFDYPSSRSQSPIPGSSPNTKLKHLKFLPKQKHFDSTEDVGFVTSTPVETDISAFPDFVSTKNSPAASFESTESDIEDPKDLLESSKYLIKKQTLERQVCPLGMTVAKVSIASELKTPVASNPPKPKVENLNPPKSLKTTQPKDSPIPKPKVPVPKKERLQKKIERTDTVIYKGPAKERYILTAPNRSLSTTKPNIPKAPIPIPIVVAPPPEEHATRLQVPVIQTTNINVQSTFSPDEMKTQHFGSIGARKFPIDECAMSERFGRKYRQHCMLDLLKTIDAKMMAHHLHHERRDSTKSKRKKRERINASATPSPDSIHRTKTHKRRSRSRSPERPHVHNKNQVSSLTTHSFPNSTSPIIKIHSNLLQDPPSLDSSSDNISRNNGNPPIVVCPIDPTEVSKENLISPGSFDVHHDDDDQLNDHETSSSNEKVVLSISDDFKLELESCASEVIDQTMQLLGPNDVDYPFIKSHSAGSLEKLRERFIVTTKMTNNPNTIDDLCVPCSPLILRQPDEQQPSSPVQTSSALPSSLGAKVTANTATGGKTNTAIPNMHRRSSDSDLSITPKGNSLAGSDRSMGGHMRPSTAIVRTMNQDTMEMLEYPFITMQQYPAGFVINIGGLVSARSVKLLERITNLEEPEGRDAWWTEIRMEVRSHARALACNVVLGYKEEISICDDVCVLNASGTAAVINLLNASQDQETILLSRTAMTTSIESDREKNQPSKNSTVKPEKSEESSVNPGQQSEPHRNPVKLKRTSESNDHEIPYLPALMSSCSLCHLPYNEASVPFRVDVSKCAICRRAKVPDVLFTTIELPENIPMTGRGVFLQATVCKCKRDLRGELNAKEISDCLPFLEYELHSLLLNKLKVKGMNAIFGLKVQVSVGERLVIGMAVGTAVYLTALPAPTVPKIASGNSWHNEEQLAEIQKTLIETVKKNREFYRLKPIVEMENGRSTTSDTDESDDDLPDLDLGIGTKDACVLEVDDVEDMDRINLLMDERPPDDFHVVNTQTIPGLEDLEIVRNLQMFTQISRAKIPAGQFASMPSKYFARMIQTVLFKLRRMVPCALCDMQFKVALPEQDEIQLSVVGMALGLGEPTRLSKYKRKLIPNSASKDPVKKTDENDMIFSLDEDQADNTSSPHDSVINQSTTNISNSSPLTGLSAAKHRPRSPFRTKSHMPHRHKHVPLKERYGVDITPLSYLPGGKIERYLGNLNFFFIRESTSIRENGGLSGFTHSFVTEILAIVRAHITALGGNAMVAFFMTQCVLLHSPHKNQGQSLINVGGDVVTVSYYGDDKYQGNQNC